MRQLTEVEQNAIMYAAGYVVRVLIQKYKNSKESLAAEYVSCLTHMLEGSSLYVQEDESFQHCASRWVMLTNRGGLLILHQRASALFRDIELLLWAFLKQLGSCEASFDNKEAIKHIVAVEAIQRKWSVRGVNITEESNSELLITEIVEKWINIRGFSYACKFIEDFKTATEHAISKDKAQQKELMKNK